MPLDKVASFRDGVHLVLSVSELAGVDVYDSHVLRPMPDRWSMPVEGVELDAATGRITRVVVQKGRLFRTETAIPACTVASVSDDRITLSVKADMVKRLEWLPAESRA